jgi:hypothetical protein
MKKSIFTLAMALLVSSPATFAADAELGMTQYLKDIPGHSRECALRSARRIPESIQDNQSAPAGRSRMRYGTVADSASE